MGDVWYLHRLRTRDDVSPLPDVSPFPDVSPLPDVSTPPTFFLGDFARTLLCCRPLLLSWLILAYLSWALLCLPGFFTRIWFLCPHCHLEFEPRSWASIHYNPTSSSVGLHVFYPRKSKCSKWWKSNFINNWTLSLLLLLFILFHNCWNLQMYWMYECASENVFTTSFGIKYTTCHLQGMKQTARLR